MDLDFVRIECEIITDTPVQLADALYNALRNFELQFKASCCPDLQEPCTTCSKHIKCPYRIVFGQQLSSDPEIIRLHQKPSLPFSLYISEIDSNASSYAVGMVVIGRAVNYFELFHAALLRMVESAMSTVFSPAKFVLRSYSLDYQGVQHEIRQNALLPESVILLSARHILQNTVHTDSVRLLMKSPLRLLSNGTIAHHFDFGLFFRSQLRRCSSLCAYYGSGEPDLDFVFLSKSVQNVAVFNDKLLYTKPSWSKQMNKAGLTGSVECSGLVEPMFSLLLLGSYFNAGKGAAFGSGYHQLELR